MNQTIASTQGLEKGRRLDLMTGIGRLVARVTRDPVLADFIEVVGRSVSTSSLFTIFAWRAAMGLGQLLSRSPRLCRWAYGRTQIFHRLNQRFDAVALAIAMTRLEDDESRLRWCRIFGINPVRDLDAPLQEFRKVNDLFTHAPGPGTRPLAAPDDDSVITAPCDGSYAFFPDTHMLRSFISKQSHFELGAVLGPRASSFQETFRGGAAAFIWLSAVDNHRWFAPMSGTVVHAETLEAQTHGRLGLFLEDGYCEANTRAVIILACEGGRLCALIPIGLTPINSVTVTVQAGQKVKKGDPLGCFEIGGSAALLFFDRRFAVDFGSELARFKAAEELLNLNYVQDTNKARRIIGEEIGRLVTVNNERI